MRLHSVFSAVAVFALGHSALAQSLPPGFVIDTLVATGLNAPHDFCFLPDGRTLISNRAGQILVYAGGPVVTIGTVPNVETAAERGIFSIAADPNFGTNGHIYVWYPHIADAFMHLDRFTCTGDLAIPTSTNLTFAAASRRVVLNAVPDNQNIHDGGAARFGPDGMLYMSIGEDDTRCPAQSVTSSLGCVLRMDVSTLPAGGSTVAPTFASLDPGTNPLSSNNTDVSQLVIAHGLRNPFRMEIDPVTGNLYIGDVGLSTWEEYDEYIYTTPLQLRNYGWPWREANLAIQSCTGTMPAVIAPIAEVTHTGTAWLACMGGPRYRNLGGASDFGPAYEGNLIFRDYFAGELRRLVNTGGTWATAPAVPGQPSATNWGTGFLYVPSMRLGPDGALWYVQHPVQYPATGGTLKRIRSLANNVTAASGQSQRGVAGEAFAQPCVAQVRNSLGQPLAGVAVNFAVAGPGTLSTSNPVISDSSGFAWTTVTAQNMGGPITVTAGTPGSTVVATFALFSRKITVSGTPTHVNLDIVNTTTAVPTSVPFVVMVGFSGAPSWNSPIGLVCTHPASYLTVVIEDGSGAFGFQSLSGTGGIGNPGLTKVYNLPNGIINGLLLKFTALGFDGVDGMFRVNCEQVQF
jgi:glucose/arabinose dehydrogenase